MNEKELLKKARELPEQPGVYIMKDISGKEIYVGKAKNLPKRVTTYFQKSDHTPKTIALVENIIDFDYIVTDTELEALLLESRLIKDLQPKYNIMLKHNELYPFIEITVDEDFPQVLVTRKKSNPKSRYFGPFAASGDLRACISQLQRIFLFRACKRRINAGNKRAFRQRGCLNYHIGRCSGVCRGEVSKVEYRRRISGLIRFLSGQKKDLIEDLRKDMQRAAAEYQYEEAGALRDLITGLENLNQYPELDDSLAPMAPVIEVEKGLLRLREALRLDFTPKTIEGIDIANLQGGQTVGSLVNFVDGQPFKDGYRRFKIKTVEGQNDFDSINEVVRRRYGRSAREGRELPDIILIDGGKGQLHSASIALQNLGITPKALISIAKKEELIYKEGHSEPIRMTRRNEGLRLLMHVRDEAHRFAQHYHHILRRKAVFGEAEK